MGARIRNPGRLALACLLGALVITGAGHGQTNIPPNYGAYTLNPLYSENQTLGWAQERVVETLDRSLVPVPGEDGSVYLGWRLLKDDPASIAFNVYRATGSGEPVKLNKNPLTVTTDFVDSNPPLRQQNRWWVRPLLDGQEQAASREAVLPANPPVQQYKAIRLRDDISTRSIHKIGIGDVNGDGTYDFIIKRPGGTRDPGRAGPSPASFKVEAYDGRTGQFLWRKDLGWNITLGTWYSPMLVYDFNGDGRAEVALKTAPYAASPEEAFISESQRILSGPEYVSVWDGETGEEIARENWIDRGKPEDWGDTSGNRMNRNMMGVAYLDGKTPSLLVLRGIYGLMKMDAWFLQDDRLHKAWSWTNQQAGWKYQGQGQHNIHVADIDNDGKDEILYGSVAVDHDGRIMWSTGNGHGDRFYLTDVDPDHPGLEVWYSYEDPHPRKGIGLWDARTGDFLFGTREPTGDDQIDRALVGDIDPAYPGMECWGNKFFYSAKGEMIPGEVPPLSGLVWWDADPLREIQTRGEVSKWKGPVLTGGIAGRVVAWGDILGDWREEIITFTDGEIRIYTTTIPASDRRVTLMQDPLYRIDVALIAQGYEQVPMTGYYLGNR